MGVDQVQYPIPSIRFCFMRKSKEASIFSEESNPLDSARKSIDNDGLATGRSGEQSQNTNLQNKPPQNMNININDEYSVLHSMDSQPNLDKFDFDKDFSKTRPNFSKKDPDIPITEDQEVQKKFPFVKSIEYGKPIETRLRASIRTKQDFESIDKLNDLGPEENEKRKNFNPYTKNKGLRNA